MKQLIKIELIENFRKENKLTKLEFCKQCRISTNTLRKIYNGNTNFDIVALFKIARVMKIAIHLLFIDSKI